MSISGRDELDDLPDKHVARDFYAKYEPKEVLGRGVSSTVRRCIEKETGKEFAAKIIDVSADLEDSQGLTLRQATIREISILKLVAGHPFIIELHDVFESKPENILLDDNYNIKITDFGFAKFINANEKLFELCGTPGYLSPEILTASMYENADGYGKEVDLWACGVIMYSLLVGFPPFWHRKQMIMLRNIMECKYEFCSPGDDITEQPKDLIRKLLVIDPSKRLTAKECLKHEFFQLSRAKHSKFNARRVFQLSILTVRAMIRIQRLRYTPEPLSVDIAKDDPYRLKTLRKAIDGCAFKVYNHWVKRSEMQNRALIFESNIMKTIQ